MKNKIMSLMFLKKFILFFLFISASLLSTSYAGRRTQFVTKAANVATLKGKSMEPVMDVEEKESVHERILKVNTKDYGRYDPTPALVRPPFKLIPN